MKLLNIDLNQIIITSGDKGGVGKSLLLEILREAVPHSSPYVISNDYPPPKRKHDRKRRWG